MPGPAKKKQASDPVSAFRWSAGPGPELLKLPDAPVLSLLALTGALLASHADGRVVVHPVAAGEGQLVGTPWELCCLDPPATALAYCGGEVVAASGSRLVRVLPDGTVLEPLALEAQIGAMVARNGRVHAVAGETVSTFERDGDGWSTVHRTPIPLSDCHDIDVDRRGKHVVVCQRPGRGHVVELGTGTLVGRCNTPLSQEKTVSESYVRFSPVTDHLYRAASRDHHVEKLGKLAKSGRSLGWKHQLNQPSTWCTPLASSPDGRHLASRQSGVGVLVWDLTTECQVLFAELDDAPAQEKFGKRMRRAPAVVKSMGPNAITVTRWKNVPEQEGEATAVAVAPGAAYAATGDWHGVVTVVDTKTRRIEQSDGRVRQPGCLSAVVPVGEATASTFTATDWFGVARDGTVTVVDLATGKTHSPGAVDMPFVAGSRPVLQIDGDELVLTGGRSACAFDRRTLAPTWRADNPLPECGPLSYSSSELLAIEQSAGPPVPTASRQIRRYQPRTGKHVVGPALQFEAASGWDEIMVSHRTGRFFIRTHLRSARDTHWYPVLPSGELGDPLPRKTRMLPDAHAVVSSGQGWAVFGVDDPERPLAVVDDIDATLGHRVHVDLAAGMVAAQDLHTNRIYVWNLDGKPVASFDGVGETAAQSFAFANAALWQLTLPGRHGLPDEGCLLYRLDLPT